MKQKYYLALTTEEWRLMIEALNNFRNRLISEGGYTDAVDEVLVKIANIETAFEGETGASEGCSSLSTPAPP